MTTATRTNPLSYLTDQLNELKAKGTHFKLRVLDDEQAPVCTFDGKKVINLASNNYLGLTTHPKLREAALEATRKFGVGSGAVRTIAGTMKIHMELEEKIARFKNVEACVVFQSGIRSERRHGLGCSRQRRLHHLRCAQSCFDHRRCTTFESKDPGLPSQRHRARRRATGYDQERAGQEAADHRRRVLHGRRHRSATRAVRSG